MKTINIPIWVWDLFAIIGIAVTLLIFLGLILYIIGRKKLNHTAKALKSLDESKEIIGELAESIINSKPEADNNGSS